MLQLTIIVAFVLLITTIFLWFIRVTDLSRVNESWHALRDLTPDTIAVFDPESISHLPEPAQRYLNFAIKPGTRLRQTVELSMHGTFSMGSKTKPNYVPIVARQILAAPHGFIWQMQSTKAMLHIDGSDGSNSNGSWTRFRLGWLIPVANISGDQDHARSAFGRYIAEAVFWTPAAVLPRNGVQWEKVDENRAMVTVTHNSMSQSVVITVDDEGAPIAVEFDRWSNANSDKEYRTQAFGGFPSDFTEYQGFVIPTRLDAGNHFGTDDYFPFYRIVLDDVEFL